jgi:threonylcarbamoyladenosine tRNA methylthiotransferase MtaB
VSSVAFYTLGCKVNRYDTEVMAEQFAAAGYERVDFEETADVYVINTCTVTHLADRKSRQQVRRALRRNPEAIVVAAGCYAQTASEELSQISGIDMVVGNSDRHRIVELVEQAGQGAQGRCHVHDIMTEKDYGQAGISGFAGRTRAVVKLQEGCNEYCSYCIIPYARGRERSRPPGEIVQEAERLAAAGFREIVLTGINLSSYGGDLSPAVTLQRVLEELHAVEELQRIRISSLEPMGVSNRLLEALADLPRMCRHLHLPLQSGADSVLQRMRRRYTTEKFRQLVQRARELMPEVNISTDVMVGFPGESRAEFEQSLQFVEELEFGGVHVFPYSEREGTQAARIGDPVDPQEVNDRRQQLLEVARESERDFYRRFVGATMEVLVESERNPESGELEGLTDNYLRVTFEGTRELLGKLVPVQLSELRETQLWGKVCRHKRSGGAISL